MTYAGSAGFSGTQTSYLQSVNMRAHRKVQTAVLQEIHRSNYVGRTVGELRLALPEFHHGSISSALTNLHRAGKIARLATVRFRSKVYVAVPYLDGREAEEPVMKPTSTVCPHCGGEVPL